MTTRAGWADEREKEEKLERLVAELEGRPAETCAAVPAADFIGVYADYADVLEAPRILHEIVGSQLVAAVLNRAGVTIPVGAVTYPLDLWVLLLSGSGAGRSTTVGLASRILKAAQMDSLQNSVRWGSGPAFYQEVAENPSGLQVWGEMAERLKMLNEPQFATVKEWITDRYDNFEIPPTFRYRTRGKPGDTPPIQFTEAPRINILATSSEAWFFGNLVHEDSSGGFLARWVFMRAEGDDRDVPIPNAQDLSLVAPLAARLSEIGRLNGPADLTAILALYRTWYSETKRRFKAQPNQALAIAYFNRHRGHILKLAVIFQASQNASLTVSVPAWERAVKVGEQVELCIFRLLPTGMNQEGSEVEKLADRIRNAGPKGMLRSELTASVKHWKRPDRENRLSNLTESKTVLMFRRETLGRNAVVYVHKDHLDAHANSYPADRPSI